MKRFLQPARRSRLRAIPWLVLAATLPCLPQPMTSAAEPTPINRPWTGPYGGVPPFDQVRVADLGPALEAAMEAELDAVATIAANPAAPTFANTIEPLERAARDFERVQTIYGIWGSNLADDAVQKVEREMAPKLADLADRIFQNQKLFDRIKTVYDARKTSGLSPEQQRLAARLPLPAAHRVDECKRHGQQLQHRDGLCVSQRHGVRIGERVGVPGEHR